jgi:hypothetical protein
VKGVPILDWASGPDTTPLPATQHALVSELRVSSPEPNGSLHVFRPTGTARLLNASASFVLLVPHAPAVAVDPPQRQVPAELVPACSRTHNPAIHCTLTAIVQDRVSTTDQKHPRCWPTCISKWCTVENKSQGRRGSTGAPLGSLHLLARCTIASGVPTHTVQLV